MSQLTAEELEGRQYACRRVLQALLCSCAEQPGFEEVLRELAGELTVLDQEEDPGVLPTEAFAVEAAKAREIKQILDGAREMMANRETRSRR